MKFSGPKDMQTTRRHLNHRLSRHWIYRFSRSTLQEAGIVTLIDIRAVPWSRNPEFTRQALAGRLAAARIAYIHLEALGNPPEGREASAAGDRAAFEAIYRRHLEGEAARAALAEAAYIAGREPNPV